MLAFLKLMLMAAVVLLIIFLCLWLYVRAGLKTRLEQDWLAAGEPGAREDWLREGLARDGPPLRRRLTLLVVALPLAAVASIIYLVNYA